MGLVDRDDGWRVPDWLWERIEPLLPEPAAHPLGCHNPRVPDRAAMDAILLVLRTGMQWNALNVTGICSSSSAHRRFQEWERAGAFHEIWRQGLLEYDREIGIDWSWSRPVAPPAGHPQAAASRQRSRACGHRG
jgi:transposase